MNLRQGIIFMLMSCYIGAYAQNESVRAESTEEVEQYYEEEYLEEEDYSRLHFVEGYLSLLDPANAFDRNLDSKYIGLGIDYLFQLSSDKPGFIGVGFDYTYLENASLTTYDPVDGFPFDHSTTTSLGGLTAIYRYYLGVNILGIQPFVEGRLGVGAMWTNTTITSSEDSEYSEYKGNNFDASISYAFRGGVHYAVANAVYVTAKVGYMSTLSTEYDARDTELFGETSSYDFYTRKRSALDAIRYDLGVTFAF